MRSTDYQINKFKDQLIGVIAGGVSSERDISFKSATNVMNTLSKLGLNAILLDPSEEAFFTTKFDIAFNCLHGKWGEDGTLQGYLELKQIPYTGPGILATSIGLNKPIFKQVISELGIKSPKTLAEDELQFPMIVKPKSEGSSIGVSIIKSKEEWLKLIKSTPEVNGPNFFKEEFIQGIEVTSGVLEIDSKATVLPILEIQSDKDILDYEVKYTPGKCKFIIPASIDSEIQTEICDISLKIYNYFNCKGCIRLDLIIDSTGPKVLEMNTSPGLTELSDIPAQASAMGISLELLVLHYLSSATL